MASRLQLQNKLEEILKSRNVYYQPPDKKMMSYPAIMYSRKNINNRFADDLSYSKTNCYEIIVIDKMPDNPVIESLLELPYCKFDRHYVADNLHHDVLTIYF